MYRRKEKIILHFNRTGPSKQRRNSQTERDSEEHNDFQNRGEIGPCILLVLTNPQSADGKKCFCACVVNIQQLGSHNSIEKISPEFSRLRVRARGVKIKYFFLIIFYASSIVSVCSTCLHFSVLYLKCKIDIFSSYSPRCNICYTLF